MLFGSEEYAKAVGVKLLKKSFTFSTFELSVKYSIAADNYFVVGEKATFGHVILSKNTPSEIACSLFLDLTHFIRQNYCGGLLRFAPEHFSYAIPSSVLDNIDCQNRIIETNQHLQLMSGDISQSFSKTQRKLAARCERSGVSVRFSRELSFEGYCLLQKNRLRRGVALSLSFDDLLMQSKTLNDKYMFCSAFNASNILIGYAVLVFIDAKVAYVLYWGDERDLTEVSPLSFMTKEINWKLYNIGFKTLDLGISSVLGDLDLGLFNFKNKLGAIATEKFICEV